MRLAALWIVAGLWGAGCGEGDAVSYAKDINPVFVQRCFVCHHSTSAIVDTSGDRKQYDFSQPFSKEVGIVGRVNSWKTAHPEARGELVVDPGNPDNSSLLVKLRETEDSIDSANNGHAMPFQIPRLSTEEVALVRQWIEDGANNDEFFQANVQPIFGTGIVLREQTMSDQPIAGKCTYCHYPGSPTGMNVLNVFDEEEGMVNAPAFTGGTIVVPGDPDRSVLMERITEAAPESRRMPKWYPRLSAEQVDQIEAWIEAGAPQN